jgi:outer membrane protein insertion porin family
VQAEVVPNAAGDLEAQRSLTVRLLIAEGVRTTIGTISFTGHSAVPEDVLRSAITAAPGSAFFVPDVARDREAVLQQYLNLGYQTASVDVVPAFSADKSRVDLRFTINEGPKALVDHLLIVGNNRTTTETIEREVLLKPGQPLSQEALVESRRRLAALGLFRRVNISELRHGSEIHRDVVVSVEEAPVTSVGYGGGLEGGLRAQRGADQGGRLVERLEFAPRGFFEIGRRNLWGKNRALNLFTRVTFHPQDQTTADPTSSAGFGFTEYRVLGTYREPKVLGTNADGLLTAAFEQAIRSSFNFSRRGTRAELARRLTPRVSVTGTYSLERTRLFDERFNQADKPLIDRLFPQVRLSSFSSSFVQDTRDDPVDPSRGSFLVLTGQLAARGIGSEVGFDKTFLQGFVYRQVPGSRRVVFAGGARLGFARGFPREVVRRDAMGHPVSGIDGQPIVDVVEDLPASERFFAGGDTTVRGFPLDQLGTAETIDQDGFPQGGHALVIFNAEMRIPVWHGIGLAGFLDAGNVFARVSDLDLGEIRGSVGVGLRYKSPVGPIRFDLGFKLDRRQFGTAPRESLTAFHVSLGQAF